MIENIKTESRVNEPMDNTNNSSLSDFLHTEEFPADLLAQRRMASPDFNLLPLNDN